ncbi:MAG: HNH endonuclease [Candidatus Shapirobacteria bacterium]
MLKEYLEYNYETGLFIWKIKPCNRVNVGDIAGHKNKLCYVHIIFKGKRILAHRLAWYFIKNEWPINDIDHINGNPSDNRIINLRLANRSENIQNQKIAHKNNKTGFLGVYLQNNGKFSSLIKINGIKKHLGTFKTQEEAHQRYIEEKRKIHPFCEI